MEGNVKVDACYGGVDESDEEFDYVNQFKYVIVKFPDDERMEIVHKSWLSENGTTCVFPPFICEKKIQDLLLKQVPPDPSWNSFEVIKQDAYYSFTEARGTLLRAQRTSDSDEELKIEGNQEFSTMVPFSHPVLVPASGLPASQVFTPPPLLEHALNADNTQLSKKPLKLPLDSPEEATGNLLDAPCTSDSDDNSQEFNHTALVFEDGMVSTLYLAPFQPLVPVKQGLNADNTQQSKKPLELPLDDLHLKKMKIFNTWDPFNPDWSRQTVGPNCLSRIRRDLKMCLEEPHQGISVAIDEADMTVVHALVIGPCGTPYEGGFFYFLMRFPPDYPLHSPRVRLMTTGEGRVHFNPNLYDSGKVCLSILGTWNGPSWCPSLNMSAVLLSIQSLMCENPYFNEPGYERFNKNGVPLSNDYNKYVSYETMRVAVCDMLEGTTNDSLNMPSSLRDVMEKHFCQFFDYYETRCRKAVDTVQGEVKEPFRGRKTAMNYKPLLQRLHAIKEKLNLKD